MESLQVQVLRQLQALHPNHTMKELASMLEIERTRFFRLFNGHQMKLAEYERIVQLIEKELGRKTKLGEEIPQKAAFPIQVGHKKEDNLIQVMEQCIQALGEEDLRDIKDLLERRLYYGSLVS